MRRRFLVAPLLLLLAVFAFSGSSSAAYPCAIFKTYITGNEVTASDMNNLQTTLGQTNMTPACVASISATLADMQAAADPYPAGVPSLPTTLTGELQRLRYVLKTALGVTQWYAHTESYSFPHAVAAPSLTIPVTTGSAVTGLRWGTAAGVTDGGTIAHGMAAGAPTACFAQASVSGEMVAVMTLDAVNLTVGIAKHDGTPGTAQSVSWLCLR